MRAALVAMVMVAVSACQQPADVDPVYSVQTVSAYDASGVGGVGCPDGSRVVGGGCTCKGFQSALYSSAPAGNGFACGCYLTAGASPGVDMYALCLASNTAGSLTQGLTRVDAELQRTVEELRAQQRR